MDAEGKKTVNATKVFIEANLQELEKTSRNPECV